MPSPKYSDIIPKEALSVSWAFQSDYCQSASSIFASSRQGLVKYFIDKYVSPDIVGAQLSISSDETYLFATINDKEISYPILKILPFEPNLTIIRPLMIEYLDNYINISIIAGGYREGDQKFKIWLIRRGTPNEYQTLIDEALFEEEELTILYSLEPWNPAYLCGMFFEIASVEEVD